MVSNEITKAHLRLLWLVVSFLATLPQVHAATIIQKTISGGRPAYRLTDGRTEAIVVPALGGRVMSYGFAGGRNWLWQSPLDKKGRPDTSIGGWYNWGGDKTWPAPQNDWRVLSGRPWPPDAEWDETAHKVSILRGGILQTESRVSPHSGARIARSFSFSDAGEFLVSQRVEKTTGKPQVISIWSVTQLAPPDAVFMATAEDSVYRNRYLAIPSLPKDIPDNVIQAVAPWALKIAPTKKATFKVGTDAATAAFVAVRGNLAFRKKTSYLPGGAYPDGPGTALTLYNSAKPGFVELETSSAIRTYHEGTAWTQTVHWSLHRLPSADTKNAETLNAIRDLLETP